MERVDSSGALISSQEYGITIVIPPGAIPEKTEIQLQICCCSSGPIVLPKGYYLCSPVYIISPSYHFLKDIVWIVHHAYLSDPEDCSQMTIVTNAPNLEAFDHRKPEYHLSPIQGGRFSVHGVVGKISVKHTCKKAIAAKFSTDGEITPHKKIEGTIYTVVSRFFSALVFVFKKPATYKFYGIIFHPLRPLRAQILYPSITIPKAGVCSCALHC